MDTWGSVPGASGLWDLGNAGSIVLSGLSGSGLTTLNVFQWVDPGTYSGLLNYSVNGVPSGSLSGGYPDWINRVERRRLVGVCGEPGRFGPG